MSNIDAPHYMPVLQPFVEFTIDRIHNFFAFNLIESFNKIFPTMHIGKSGFLSPEREGMRAGNGGANSGASIYKGVVRSPRP